MKPIDEIMQELTDGFAFMEPLCSPGFFEDVKKAILQARVEAWTEAINESAKIAELYACHVCTSGRSAAKAIRSQREKE